jgi:hypothetical protein
MATDSMSFASGRIRFVIAAAILIAGAVMYAFLGTATQVDGQRMAGLVVPKTGIAQFESRPLKSTFGPPSTSSFSLVKQAGASHPTETGSYQETWRAKGSQTNEAGVLIQLLPTPTLARSLQRELKGDYSEAKKLSAESLELTHTFTVGALPGAFAASYREKSSTTSPSVSTNVYIVLFRVNRVAALVLMQSTNTAIGEQDARSLAVLEARHLETTEPGFSLAQTVRPALLALWFGLGTLAASGTILILPWLMRLVRRRRERKEERIRLRARRHVHSRGSKVLNRRRAPAGRQRHPAGGRRR